MIVFVDDFARKSDRPSVIEISNRPYAPPLPQTTHLIENVAQIAHSVCELINKPYAFYTESEEKIDPSDNGLHTTGRLRFLRFSRLLADNATNPQITGHMQKIRVLDV